PLGDRPLDSLVMSLLAKDPAERPPTRELVARLDELAEGARRLELDSRRRDPSLAGASTMLAGRAEPRRPTPVSNGLFVSAGAAAQAGPSGDDSTMAPNGPSATTASPAASPLASPAASSPAVRSWEAAPGSNVLFADDALAVATCGRVLIHVLRRPLT